MHKIIELDYEYSDLEPWIDEETVQLHYTKHHQSYADRLNKALEGHDIADKEIEELLQNPDLIPEGIRDAVMKNGGQVLNHNLFFSNLKKDVQISGKILELIENNFGDFESFKKKFSETAMSVFGSGWVWLVLDGEKLKIMKTSNHETPIMQGKKAILVLDMWEHSFYLKYQNRKSEYIENFFKVINWNKINSLIN